MSGQSVSASIPRNIVTNLASSAAVAVLSFVFVPVYIHVLGMETFGLIGFFASLQALFSLFDLGIGGAANRELARLSTNPGRHSEARKFLRTLETLYWLIAAAIALLVMASASLIARDWLTLRELGSEEVEQALMLMGLSLAARWPFTLYVGALNGLERQPLLNLIRVVTEVIRSAGAALAILYISPTLTVFLVWQIGSSLVASLLIAWITWQILPSADGKPRFEWQQLRHVWRYMMGLSAISVSVVVLTQIDKVILSRLLSLEAFGYYALAWAVANALTLLVAPVFSAYFPGLARSVANGDEFALRTLFHRGSQVMSSILVPVGVTLALFAREILALWTQDPLIAQMAHVALSILVLGTVLNGLMNIPYALLLAHGWTSLPFYANLTAIVILVPTIVFATNAYGPIGAASAWLLLNVGHMVITQHLMHRKILRQEKRSWYVNDVAKPLLICTAIGGAARLAFDDLSGARLVIVGPAVILLCAIACVWSQSYLRQSSQILAHRLFEWSNFK